MTGIPIKRIVPPPPPSIVGLPGSPMNIAPLGVLLWDNKEVDPGTPKVIDTFGYTYVTLFVEVSRPAIIVLESVSQDGSNWRDVGDFIKIFDEAGRAFINLNVMVKTKEVLLYRYLKLRIYAAVPVKITLEAVTKLMDLVPVLHEINNSIKKGFGIPIETPREWLFDTKMAADKEFLEMITNEKEFFDKILRGEMTFKELIKEKEHIERILEREYIEKELKERLIKEKELIERTLETEIERIYEKEEITKEERELIEKYFEKEVLTEKEKELIEKIFEKEVTITEKELIEKIIEEKTIIETILEEKTFTEKILKEEITREEITTVMEKEKIIEKETEVVILEETAEVEVLKELLTKVDGIHTILTNPDTWDHDQKNVTTPGTPVQLSGLIVPDGYSVIVKAKSANAGNIYAGNSKDTVQDTTKRTTLGANEVTDLKVKKASVVWIDADTAGEGVEYWCEKRK